MKHLLMLIALAALSMTSYAAPFAQASVAGAPTHCVFDVDGTVTVVTVATGTCKTDLVAVTVGAHTVKVKARTVDPLWGNLESAETTPLAFSRPGVPPTPTGLTLTP